jgi:sucrose phosphorylase
VQFFLPGEPQVYYVGLFNGMDDRELFARTGQGRDTNRHHYTSAEIEAALEQPVTQAIIALARLRKHAAFDGDFSYADTGGASIRLMWTKGEDTISLEIDTTVGNPSFAIEATTDAGLARFASVAELATARI